MKNGKIITGFEIFLVVSLSFAFSFVLEENFVGGQGKKIGFPPGSSTSIDGVVIDTNRRGISRVVPGTNSPASVPESIVNTNVLSDAEIAAYQEKGILFPGENVGGAGKIFADGKGGAFRLEADGTRTALGPGDLGAKGGVGTPAEGFGGILKGTAFGTQSTFASVSGGLLTGAAWGGIVYGATLLIASALGLSDTEAESLAMGLGAGTFVGTSTYFVSNNLAGAGAGISGTASFLIGAGVAAVIIVFTYKKQKVEVVRFECNAWEAPLGGSKCDECNSDPLLPCSEYRCKSLGQACDLINKGSTEEACVWVNREDTQAPKIIPSEELLRPESLTYQPDPTISPPNTGFRIVTPAGGCMEPYSKFEYGFLTDELAQCRTSLDLTESYETMGAFFGNNNLFVEEHVQEIKVPSPFNQEDGGNVVPEIHNDGIYTIWTRCIDANGNGNDAAAVAFRFCVNPGPDLRAPIVEGFSIEDGSPVRFNADSVPIEVYTNEPSECKWSRQDQAFDAMPNKMECATESYQINSELNYVCSSSLTGIKNREDNTFYFRCKDQPGKPENKRNLMATSKSLTLRGTEELVIVNVGPKGTFKGGGGTSVVTTNLTVETAHGEKDGEATCYFSDVNEESSFIVPMQGHGTHKHSQPLDLVAGDYTYYFRCVDDGGNAAFAETNFKVEIDSGIPQITRAFRDIDSLKIITDEDARCFYSLNSCNYNIEEVTDTVFIYDDPNNKKVHVAPWDVGKTYYVKCADLQGNQPAPTQCQLIVEGSEL